MDGLGWWMAGLQRTAAGGSMRGLLTGAEDSGIG